MAVKTLRLPIFRTFTHPKLENVGLKGGVAGPKELVEMSNVTNVLIDKGLHRPPLKQTHAGSLDGTSRGWIDRLDVEGNILYGLVSFTETAQRQAQSGDMRWFSSGIKRDFSMTGEPTGPVLPGLYLDHVAMLGDQHPQVKGLIDLSTVAFGEGDEAPDTDTMFFSYNETNGEVTCYFAESTIREEGDSTMTTTPPAVDTSAAGIALFMQTTTTRIEGLSTELSEQKTKNTALEAELATYKNKEKEATFAEYDTKVLTPAITAATETLKLGAEDQKHFRVIGAACFGNRDAEAAFTAAMKPLGPKVPATRLAAAVQGDATAAEMSEELKAMPGSAEFGEGNTKLTAADFSEAISDPKMGQRINRVLEFERARRKVPTLTFAALRAEHANKK